MFQDVSNSAYASCLREHFAPVPAPNTYARPMPIAPGRIAYASIITVPLQEPFIHKET